MNKTQERLIVAALVAFLVGMFIYQVAYGMESNATSFSNYLNGTMTETFDNGTTKAFQKGSPEYNATHTGHWFDPANSTWTMYNSTSGSVSKITFSSGMMDDGFLHSQIFIRILNGHTHKGTYIGPYLRPGDDLKKLAPGNTFNLCENIHYKGLFPSVCAILHPIVLNSDHMEFKDDHGGIIHLIRQL